MANMDKAKKTETSKNGKLPTKVPPNTKKKKKSETKMGNGSSAGTGDLTVTEFYSAGTRATQPLFSDLRRNHYATMNLNGNPYFTGTVPSAAACKYDYNRTAVAVGDYFVDNLFGAYEYYRVKKIETTFTWCNPQGQNGAAYVNGELYYALDRDSRDSETSNEYINRRNLKRQYFNNHSLSHSYSYQPYMVDYVDDDEGEQVKYIQPAERWWNCKDFRNHRWGCLRYVLINNNAVGTDANVFVRHRLWIECKGQTNVITPSIPPEVLSYGKQNLEKTSSDDRRSCGPTSSTSSHAGREVGTTLPKQRSRAESVASQRSLF